MLTHPIVFADLGALSYATFIFAKDIFFRRRWNIIPAQENWWRLSMTGDRKQLSSHVHYCLYARFFVSQWGLLPLRRGCGPFQYSSCLKPWRGLYFEAAQYSLYLHLSVCFIYLWKLHDSGNSIDGSAWNNSFHLRFSMRKMFDSRVPLIFPADVLLFCLSLFQVISPFYVPVQYECYRFFLTHPRNLTLPSSSIFFLLLSNFEKVLHLLLLSPQILKIQLYTIHTQYHLDQYRT